MSVCTLLPSSRSTPRRSLWAGSSKHGDGQVLLFSISAFWVSGAPLFDQRLQVVDDQGLAYDFRFLTDDAAGVPDGEVDGWFPVAHVLPFADAGRAIMAELERRHLTGASPFGI